MIAAVRLIDLWVKKILTAFCAIFLLLMVVFAVYNVVMRYVFENPPVWGDLLTVLSNIWLVFLALALTVRDKNHIALDLIYSWLPVNPRRLTWRAPAGSAPNLLRRHQDI